MAAYNLVARINSQIFQFQDIKGCRLHFWLNASASASASVRSAHPRGRSLLDISV